MEGSFADLLDFELFVGSADYNKEAEKMNVKIQEARKNEVGKNTAHVTKCRSAKRKSDGDQFYGAHRQRAGSHNSGRLLDPMYPTAERFEAETSDSFELETLFSEEIWMIVISELNFALNYSCIIIKCLWTPNKPQQALFLQMNWT